MNDRQVQEALRSIGWPITVDGNLGPVTRQAVHDFQAGLAFITLATDGVPGPATRHELAVCLDRGGRCSRHFTYREFRSKGNGWIKVSRLLVWHLDGYRDQFGATSIISGYRDPAHNRRVGGASQSRHMKADAADLKPVATVAQARALGFKGIGFNRSSGRVAHLDMRPGGVVVWRYGR